ncbi:xanthine dehydrogenase family protein molybdopterin-binding subunit [Brevibacillus sp. TJ4]|uniref:xanthine dehydrogenase family protein molybdopterin-binding subunit n=1 Tax=Brevibacillus sp. TJ4 TaxID=3234853 RepID=UPI003BA2E6EF
MEDYRFVLGKGKYVADVKLEGMKHVAVVASPHAHARIVSIDVSEALAVPGVIGIVTGEDIARDTVPLRQYIDVPGIEWRPLAYEEVRYAGEWVVAILADDRYIAEDAAELVKVEYEPLPFVIDPEKAMEPDAPVVHKGTSSNVVWQRKFVWGEVDQVFSSASHKVQARYRWNRNSTVPLETFGVVCKWDEGNRILDVWASIQMPQYAEQMASALKIPLNGVRVHYDVDVGGSYGVKRGIKHSVLTGYLARRFGVPTKFIEDRMENMRAGDMHGPDRIFEVEAAYDSDGIINGLKIRTIDDEGAYPGRSPLQMGKPVGAIVGAYKIKCVEYEGIAVVTNKTGQVAVRGFGQSPTNWIIEMTVNQIAKELGMDPVEIRQKNFIQPEEFPYEIPSGTKYDSGNYPVVLQKALDLANYEELIRWRDEARKQGRIVGIGIGTCIEPGGGNALFEPLLNPKNDKTTFPEGCQVKVDQYGKVVAQIGFSSSGQGHQTMVATILAEELGLERDDIRVIHSDSLTALPSQSPVASRMAIVLGGAVSGAAQRLKKRMLEIAAHNLQVPEEQLYWDLSTIRVKDEPERALTWKEIVDIAHLKYHKMPEGMDPGLQSQFVLEVPLGGVLPTPEGRVQMYPCYSFSAHIPVIEIDPVTGKIEFLKYFIADDCGTVINPDIVKGMVIGGVAHGIGVALYEHFTYDENGQMTAQTFMDYLMPSTMEVPHIELVKHCTPSPLTSLGQKGVGEGGYMSAPAAIVNAINDALEPYEHVMRHVPVRPQDVLEVITR